MTKTAIVDIDNCLCPSLFKNIKHNDNDRLRTPEFEKELYEVKPFPWVKKWDWSESNYERVDAISGRLREHMEVSSKWLLVHMERKVPVYCVEWDDSYPTREESYKQYVKEKILKISFQICWSFTKDWDGNRPDQIDVFDDDYQVMRNLEKMWECWNVKFYYVKNGELYK